MKKYSVLMAVYMKDDVKFLELAIQSMLDQTIKPEQFVIVKDGPVTGEIESVIKKYVDDNKELFTIVEIQNNQGLANALNEGIRVCRNELIARMDADDISLPKRCEKELEMFEKYKKLSICGCNIDEFYDDIKDIHTSRVVPTSYEEICKFMKRRQPFNHPTVMYSKNMLERVGGYSDLKRKEDFDLFSRCIAEGYYALNIDESLYLYRANEGNYLRRKSSLNLKSAIQVYKLHYKRKACSLIDFMVIVSVEIIFYILPTSMMKWLSDTLLRKKYNQNEGENEKKY